jgi:hypothetical protein
MRVDVMHVSMQFGDPTPQQRHDVDAIFTRAATRNVRWITGTEAGAGADRLAALLKEGANEHGYRFFKPKAPTDAWVAVQRSFIDGGWKTGYIPVIPGSGTLYKPQGIPVKALPRWGPKGLVHVRFRNATLGVFHVGASHYLTDARHPHAVIKGVDHWEWNKRLARAIGDWGDHAQATGGLPFYGGDQNMADSKNREPQGDTFFGEHFTSLADELHKWQNTGHGPIDVIASHDRARRVKGAYWRVLDDREFMLYTDHVLCEGGFDVKAVG